MADPTDERAELDSRVQDPTALEEIELYAELIILAGRSSRRLTRAQIDRALGLRAPRLADRAPRSAWSSSSSIPASMAPTGR